MDHIPQQASPGRPYTPSPATGRTARPAIQSGSGPAKAPDLPPVIQKTIENLKNIPLGFHDKNIAHHEIHQFICLENSAGRYFQLAANYNGKVIPDHNEGLFIPSNEGHPPLFNGKPLSESNAIPKEYEAAISSVFHNIVLHESPLDAKDKFGRQGLEFMKDLMDTKQYQPGFLEDARINPRNMPIAKTIYIDEKQYVLSQDKEGTLRLQTDLDFRLQKDAGVTVKKGQTPQMTEAWKGVLQQLGASNFSATPEAEDTVVKKTKKTKSSPKESTSKPSSKSSESTASKTTHSLKNVFRKPKG